MSAPTVQFASGAIRAERKPRYDLIPSGPLVRLADRYEMGFVRYGENNWQKGMPLADTLNHTIDHLLQYRTRMKQLRSGAPDFASFLDQAKVLSGLPDDDLAGAAWGCFALMWLEAEGSFTDD